MPHKKQPRDLLPPPERRGLSREEAAAYYRVSPTSFDLMIAAGTAPKPRVMLPTTRAVWDRLELDEMMSALPHKGEDAVYEDLPEPQI